MQNCTNFIISASLKMRVTALESINRISWNFLLRIFYITHKNIPVILLVDTTSHDIKYYEYIPDIWREGKTLL